MTIEANSVFERQMRIAARPETVYEFFVDPVKMIRWKGKDAALDPRPGGVYRVTVTDRDVARGEYLALEPYTRIVFTWGWEAKGHPFPPGSTTVEVLLTPDGEGTLLHLRHSGLTPEGVEQHSIGWDHFLPRLAEVAAGGDPGPDPWLMAPPNPEGGHPQ